MREKIDGKTDTVK